MIERMPYIKTRRQMEMSKIVLFFMVLVLSSPPAAFAFSADVHRAVTERALRAVVQTGMTANPDEKLLVKFWIWFGQAMASSSDPTRDGMDPQDFISRYPNPRDFNAIAVRGFLGLQQVGGEQIVGIESFDRADIIDRFNTIVAASVVPDVDKRNQNRYAYDKGHNVVTLKDGRKVPADPMILNMGGVEGLVSQAHAHYQLAADKPSSDPEVLQKEPWNFVIALGFPGKVETYGADMAQMHLDMAILVKYFSDEQINSLGDYLSHVWTGAGLHYIEDVAGPLHTVQVGSYNLFKAAKLAYYREALLTAGGTIAPLRSFFSIGVDFLGNCHLLSEAWLAREVDHAMGGKACQPAIAAALSSLDKDDPEFLAAVGKQIDPFLTGQFTKQPFENGEGAGNILAHTLATMASREGAQLYDATMTVVNKRWLTVGEKFGTNAVIKDTDLADPADPEVKKALAIMAGIHARSLQRAATAARLYYKAYQMGSPDAAARRLRRTRLLRLAASEERLKIYLEHPGAASSQTVREPIWLYGEAATATVLLTGLVTVVWRVRRRKKKPVVGSQDVVG